MRYVVLAIGFSALLLWDAVGNESDLRLQALRLLNLTLKGLGL